MLKCRCLVSLLRPCIAEAVSLRPGATPLASDTLRGPGAGRVARARGSLSRGRVYVYVWRPTRLAGNTRLGGGQFGSQLWFSQVN